MALKFGGKPSGSGSRSSWKAAKGVYVNAGVIRAARAEYNTSMVENSQYKDDIALRLKIDQDGVDWTKELYIGGRFKKDGTPHGGDMISGWGSAFKVSRVFEVLGIQGDIDEEGRLPQKAIDALIGRKLFFLQYVKGLNKKGKPSYSDYRLVDAPRSEDDTPEEITNRLYDSFAKDLAGNYIKNFDPDAVDEAADKELDFPGDDNDSSGSTGWDSF